MVWSSIETGYSDTIMWGDYDNDGDLDQLVSNSSGPSSIYRNENSDRLALYGLARRQP